MPFNSNTVASAILDIKGVDVSVLQDDWDRPVPEVVINLTDDWGRPSPAEIVEALAAGEPPIIVIGERHRTEEHLSINPYGLMDGEAELIGQRLRTVMVGE